ncbi:MAG: glutathione S-transferase family protein [Pseudomonadota bacterium]
MSNDFILHHYENSPYAEKIRLMFGLTESRWASLQSPPWPPRPNVDPLSGGYRRIPIAQIGADIFCDTALISREVADLTESPSLNPGNASAEARELMDLAELKGFFSAILSLPASKLLGTMLRSFGPIGAYRFIKDRSGIMKGGTSKPPAADDARQVMQQLFAALDARLSEYEWVDGESPSIADLTTYHPIWLHLNCGGRLPSEMAKLRTWFERVGEIGQGDRQEIGRDDAFASARDSAPRALPPSDDDGESELGGSVQVAPCDYGVVPVSGTLVARTAERIVIARETPEFGTLHVHFPNSGYRVSPC